MKKKEWPYVFVSFYMLLDLPDSDIEQLLKLAYLGEIMMNEWTREPDLTREQQSASELLLYLCAKASDTSAGHLVMHDAVMDEWMPSMQMIEEMEPFIHEYDQEVLRDELIRNLARRDLAEEYGEEDILHMADAHFKEAQSPLLDYYYDEIQTNGIDRLRIVEGN